MAPSELQRQVSQNKNDIEDVYKLLTETNKTVATIDHRLTMVDHRLTMVDHCLTTVDQRLTTVAVIQQRHGHRFGQLQQSIDRIEAHQHHQDTRLDTIDARLDTIDGTLREHAMRLGTIDTRLDAIDTKVDSIGVQMAEVLAIVRGGAQRRPAEK